jgi:hypothetical protein
VRRPVDDIFPIAEFELGKWAWWGLLVASRRPGGISLIFSIFFGVAGISW